MIAPDVSARFTGRSTRYWTITPRTAPATIAPDGATQVSVEVRNTGMRPGEEIVQLYIHAGVSLPTRPVMELKDFARVELQPSETKTVTFALTPEKLAALGLDMKPVVQPGEFEIMVGRSSVDYLKSILTVR